MMLYYVVIIISIRFITKGENVMNRYFDCVIYLLLDIYSLKKDKYI